VAEHGDQDRRDGHGPGGALGPVLEAALLVAGAVASPGRAVPAAAGGFNIAG
jgi:hypothetical protein